MLSSFQYVFFHELAFTGKWNIHPWDDDCYSEELKNSIIKTGILHPPFLLQHQDKKFEVVSGHKRLLIAHNYLESEKIGCFILPEKLPAESTLDLLLTDQSNVPLSLAEKARFIQIATEYMTKEEIVKNFSARLEIREQTSAINEMLDILDMDISIVKEIHSGRLQFKMTGELLRIKSPADRLALVSLFRDLSLGGGKQKKLFSLIRDLAYRNQISISDFLKSDSLQHILNHKEMNPPQKTQHLGNFLQEKLTPTYLESENNFANFSKELKLPKNFSLSHSQAFETDAVTLSIVFKNSKECRQLLPKIKSVLR
jgi:hypothetical protein